MKSISLSNLYHSLSRVSTEAVLNQLQVKKPALRKYLQANFNESYGQGAGFLSDPLIESTFGWASAGDFGGKNSMSDLAQEDILSPLLVNVMDTAPVHPKKRTDDLADGISRVEYDEQITEDEDSRWPADRPPYTHQLEAWKILGQAAPQSVVVTAGTGSGKSECFMVPMLNDLARQIEHSDEQLVGIQAIMLYPLNALINSQRDRLIGWTRGFQGKVRFALYNGETPKDLAAERTENQKAWHGTEKPEEVRDRKNIRQTPPPILVTNATMLEYMLVRPEDRPILDKSQGRLKWIILDEAHTLVGSAAAETALLLRRTMLAFGVQPKDVRFVATSATIGDARKQAETDKKLRAFLADLAGVELEQIHIVRGHRHVPPLPDYKGESKNISLDALSPLSSSEAFKALCLMPLMRSLRDKLVQGPMTLRNISAHLHPDQKKVDLTKEHLSSTMKIIDIATDAYHEGDDSNDAFLPIRAHIFHRAQRGIWACVNPGCSGKDNSTLKDEWPFGKVYLDERQCCDCCDYPVFELTHCTKCNEPSLSAVRYIGENGLTSLKPRELIEIDEFSDEVEFSDTESENQAELHTHGKRDQIVQIYTQKSETDARHIESGGATQAFITTLTGELSHSPNDGDKVKILYTMAHDNSGVRCACCNTVEKEEGKVFKRAILGSPFLMGNIVPEMLRHIPGIAPTEMAGRRLITFTDSRQGTARFSARLQLDAERRWTRSVVYRHLLKKSPDAVELSAADLADIDKFEALLEDPNYSEFASEKIAQIKSKAAVVSKPITWTEMIDIFAEREEIRLLSGSGNFQDDRLPGEYAEREERFESTNQLARLFLLREFARRPLNSNNLESLGLVRVVYPNLNKISEDNAREFVPDWFKIGFTFDQWKTFLKIFLDFYIREETIIDLKPDEKNWMGARLFARLLQPQNFVYSSEPKIREQEHSAYKVVPRARDSSPHRLVRLLELASNCSSITDPGTFDLILDAAFHTLKDLDILEWTEFDEREVGYGEEALSFKRKGYQLKLESLAFELITTAYLCPLTQRWLDNPMMGPALEGTNGVTPITTGKLQLADIRIEHPPVEIPHPDKSLIGSTPDAVIQLMDWLQSSEEILSLRSEGLWRDLNDAAIKPPALIRSREHSAQQASGNLKSFEKAFKNNALHVLNCSTTMEMGVDIGSLSMVAMNNAPPSTANYLQRAGRAGRRGQSTSVVLTFCKATPHGERIFADPTWPFSATPVPKVALDSAIIVRRHVNAYLLAHFLINTFQNEDLVLSKAGEFFLSDYEYTKADLFLTWLEDVALADVSLLTGLETLIQGTALESLSETAIIQSSREQLSKVCKHWTNRYEAIAQVLEESDAKAEDGTGKKVVDSAYRRLQNQLDGMKKEYLLSVLANRGFLPGYGFPTNVVEFVTNNKVEDRKKRSRKRWERPDYPSRPLDVAIREYEPGKDVVLNGAVYRSAGLQLSWKIPKSEHEVSRLQSLSYLAYCECGYHTAHHDSKDTLPFSCPECSRKLKHMEYIVPAGFQVDYYAPLHNDYTRPEYAKFRTPLVTIDEADWQALGKKDYGRFRATQTGNLFHYNDGNGAGFAFCWHCGRVHTIEAWPNQDDKPTISDKERERIIKPHRRLQGTKKNGSYNCPNEPWSMKAGRINKETQEIVTPLALGFGSTTTMLELQLRNPETNQWISDRVLATSLGTAMRFAFSEMEGIAESELGISIQGRTSPEGQPATSIFIFDKASQGAGYATQLAEKIPEVLSAAYHFALSCSGVCDKACHGCLLDFETQHQLANLDRHSIIKFFDETCLIERLTVPEGRRFFGELSRSELLNAHSLLSLKGARANEIDVFVSGIDWDLVDNPSLKKLKAFSSSKVRLLIAKDIVESIDPELAWQLQRTVDVDICIETYDKPSKLSAGVTPILRLLIKGEEFWYVTDDEESVSLNGQWGNTEKESLITNNGASFSVVTAPLDLSEMSEKSSLEANIGIITDVRSLSSDISLFGNAFVKLLLESIPSLEKVLRSEIERITYQDRYLMSPISVLLVAEIFAGFNERFGRFDAEIETTYPIGKERKPVCFADNFNDTDSWVEFVDGITDATGINIFHEFVEKRELPHGRALTIYTKNNGAFRLLFDQGMGHWSYRSLYSQTRFNFDDSRAEGENYRNSGIRVREGSGETYVVIHKLH